MNAPKTLRDLFEAALALPDSARAAYLAQHCADDRQRAVIERMLIADAEAEGALLDRPMDVALNRIGEPNATPALAFGTTVGPFSILEKLGEGGSSIVFRATREQSGVTQFVALKLLRRGVYSSEEQRQFRHERHALAQLRHPGIARLIEGGITSAGVPYIALELVDGVPVTDYVRVHRLDLRRRLEIFVAICSAVEAAHRALIVHRDLKPSNVLVTTDGNVKLLDFGIAKLLDAGIEDPTRTQHGALTPAYAAPEQFERGLITTATDVYALGILLNEIVTGNRRVADDSATPSSRISEKSPQDVLPASPRITRRLLRGDLDNIIMKATQLDADSRYASAGIFAEDVSRYLEGRPVIAHPPSSWYRTRKFVARHWGVVITSTAFLLVVFATLALALWQAGIARQEAARANLVRDFVVSVFQSAGADLPKDKRPTAEDLVEQATKRLMDQGRLSDATRADLLLALAKVSATLGAFDQALTLLDRAQPLVDKVYEPNDDPWLDTRVTRASALDGKNESATIIALLEPLTARMLARRDDIGFSGLGFLAIAIGRNDSTHIDQSLELFRQARDSAATEPIKLANASLTLAIQEANFLFDVRRFREGLDLANVAVDLWQQQGAPINPHIAELYGAVALGAEAIGDIPRAEAAYQQAIALDKRFFDKPNPRSAWDIGIYGTFLVAQGRYAEAEPFLRDGLELRKLVFGENDSRTLYALSGMGKLFSGENRFDEAERWYGQGVDICQRDHISNNVCTQLQSLRGYVRGAQGHFDDAERDLREALDAQRKLSGESSPLFGYALNVLVTVQVRQGKFKEAIATADQVLAINKNAQGGMIQADLNTRYWRARALYGLKRNDEALSEIIDVESKYSTLFPNAASRFGMMLLKARALESAKRFPEAATAAQNALALPKKPAVVEIGSFEDLKRIAALSAL